MLGKHRLIYLLLTLLLFLPVMVWGCPVQEGPAIPDQPVEEPSPPEEPDDPPPPPDEVNDRPWIEAHQLEPEKRKTLIIEGMEEEIVLQLQVSSLYPYAIYIEEERYRTEERAEKDYILPRAEVQPEVFMAIWHREDVQISALLSEIEEQLQHQYGPMHVEGPVESPLPAERLYAISGHDWDDTVERYYLVEDFKDGVFVIQQKLFIEAVEGHGARFDGMLEQFYSWDWQKGQFIQP